MKSAAPAVEYAPIFDWSQPRSRRVSLISFVAASAVLHALCFYLFQIIYPPTVALLPPPARVSVITPASEEGRVLLRWIEAEDPALTSTSQRASEAASLALPKIEHVPSYVSRQPALRKLPPVQPDLSVPSSNPPAPVPLARASTPSAAPATPTEIKFAEEAGALGKPILPPPQFKASSKEPPQAAEFRLAINALGEVRYCFLKNSSGDPQLDGQAARNLLQVRFPEMKTSPTEDALLWTTAIFEWGNDLATP